MTSSIGNGLFVFGIPLVPKRRSKSWSRVLENLQATLQSILNQTEPNFIVLIAAEDDIDLPEMNDARVRVLKVRGPQSAEGDYAEKKADQKINCIALCEEARRLMAGHFFMVDADDLISKNVVDFVKRNPHPYGYAFTRGHVFDCASGKVLPCPGKFINVSRFDVFCGTSLIYTLNNGNGLPYDNWPVPMIEIGHNKAVRTLREASTPLFEIDKPMIVYVLNSGENVTMQAADDNPYSTFAAQVTNAIARHGRPMTRQELDEFGLLFGE